MSCGAGYGSMLKYTVIMNNKNNGISEGTWAVGVVAMEVLWWGVG